MKPHADAHSCLLIRLLKKLSNERFVQNAKGDIVEKERQKLADGRQKLKSLQESLQTL